jgi:transcriptional regulator with XRE-family HTH domain
MGQDSHGEASNGAGRERLETQRQARRATPGKLARRHGPDHVAGNGAAGLGWTSDGPAKALRHVDVGPGVPLSVPGLDDLPQAIPAGGRPVTTAVDDRGSVWTGIRAGALRNALGVTVAEFAQRLGVTERAVWRWEKSPDIVPRETTQEALTVILGLASQPARKRFRQFVRALTKADAQYERRVRVPLLRPLRLSGPQPWWDSPAASTALAAQDLGRVFAWL